MSRFHIGQPVWIGYCPDRECWAKHARCQPGTIIAGPRPPGPGKHSYFKDTSWSVAVNGRRVRASEKILFPLPPDREVDIEQCLELTE